MAVYRSLLLAFTLSACSDFGIDQVEVMEETFEPPPPPPVRWLSLLDTSSSMDEHVGQVRSIVMDLAHRLGGSPGFVAEVVPVRFMSDEVLESVLLTSAADLPTSPAEVQQVLPSYVTQGASRQGERLLGALLAIGQRRFASYVPDIQGETWQTVVLLAGDEPYYRPSAAELSAVTELLETWREDTGPITLLAAVGHDMLTDSALANLSEEQDGFVFDLSSAAAQPLSLAMEQITQRVSLARCQLELNAEPRWETLDVVWNDGRRVDWEPLPGERALSVPCATDAARSEVRVRYELAAP